MFPHDIAGLAKVLREIAEMYPVKRLMPDHLVNLYFGVLRPFELTDVSKACLTLLGDETRKNTMPTAAEIKKTILAARHPTPPPPAPQPWQTPAEAQPKASIEDLFTALAEEFPDNPLYGERLRARERDHPPIPDTGKEIDDA